MRRMSVLLKALISWRNELQCNEEPCVVGHMERRGTRRKLCAMPVGFPKVVSCCRIAKESAHSFVLPQRRTMTKHTYSLIFLTTMLSEDDLQGLATYTSHILRTSIRSYGICS